MRQCLPLALALAMLSACASESPLTPVPVPPLDLAVPASLTLNAAIGQGTEAGRSTVTARVLNGVGGKLAGQVVTFATDVGTLSTRTGTTTADGTTATVLTAPSTATITATTGSLTTKTLVSSQPLIVPIPPSVPPPVVPPIVIPPPVLSPGYTVTLVAAPSTVVAGHSSTLTATVALLNGATAPTAYDWDCTNDGVIDFPNTVANTQACLYATAGSPTARVTARNATTTGLGATTVTVLPGLVVALTCTATAHGSATPCNVNVSYGGILLPATAITAVDWVWGDGFTNTTVPPTAPVSSRTYAAAGSFTVFATVTATTVDGTKIATASQALTIP